MNSTLLEIATYLKSEDLQLARRRILDAAFDSRDPNIIRKTIDWSKIIKTYSAPYPEDLLQKGKTILDEISTKDHPDLSGKGNLLSAKGISKQYRRGNFKLNPIDVEINYGDVWGVVGENGNGKTTTSPAEGMTMLYPPLVSANLQRVQLR